MHISFQILIALLLDQLLGDPRWLPHPVRLIGWIATRLEGLFRYLIKAERLAGFLTILFTLAVIFMLSFGLIQAGNHLHPYLGTALSIYLIYVSIAARDLKYHSMAVYRPLKAGNLSAARRQVAMFVGRQTDKLDEPGIARAAIESVAESMVDGVTAPIFFAFIGGPLGAILYRAVNTGDSMFGYKNDRYIRFGWAAARLDDICNFIPARLTGLLIPLAALLRGYDWRNSLKIFLRDRKNHKSPNSAHPEAAVAGALKIKLGGANFYFGKLVDKPTIGEATTGIAAVHIIQANRLLNATTAIFYLLISILSYAARSINFPG